MKAISVKRILLRSLAYLLLILLTLGTLLPFYSMFIMGTYDSYKLFQFNGLPSNYLMQNLQTVLKTDLLVFFKNSGIVSFCSIILGLLSCSLCGYGLSKYRFKGRNFLYKLVLFTMMVPVQLGIVAYVWEMRILHLNNTLVPSIIPFVFMGFGTFWMTQYIRDAVPNEIIESARIDSAGEFRIFFSIITRLISPAYLTLGLLIFIWSWNGFFIPLITLSNAKLYTLPLGMASFNGMYMTDNGAKILALSLATLPVLIVYIFAANSFMSGLTAGAVKG